MWEINALASRERERPESFQRRHRILAPLSPARGLLSPQRRRDTEGVGCERSSRRQKVFVPLSRGPHLAKTRDRNRARYPETA